MRTANEEIDRLDAEYAELKPCEVNHIHPGLKVKYNGLWSMLDGKLWQGWIFGVFKKCMGKLGWALLKTDLRVAKRFGDQTFKFEIPFQTFNQKQKSSKQTLAGTLIKRECL